MFKYILHAISTSKTIFIGILSPVPTHSVVCGYLSLVPFAYCPIKDLFQPIAWFVCTCLTLCQSTLVSKFDIEYRLDINKNMKSTVSKTESVVNRSIGHNPKFELFREGAINLETMMPKALSSHTVVCMTQVKIPQERLVKKLWISTCYLR